MITSAVLAVALNAVPVNVETAPQSVRVAGQNMSELVLNCRQSVDRNGTAHLVGVDRKGRSFDITVSPKGDVEGSVGPWEVSFHSAAAS
jgi:hypothetical protein